MNINYNHRSQTCCFTFKHVGGSGKTHWGVYPPSHFFPVQGAARVGKKGLVQVLDFHEIVNYTYLAEGTAKD